MTSLVWSHGRKTHTKQIIFDNDGIRTHRHNMRMLNWTKSNSTLSPFNNSFDTINCEDFSSRHRGLLVKHVTVDKSNKRLGHGLTTLFFLFFFISSLFVLSFFLVLILHNPTNLSVQPNKQFYCIFGKFKRNSPRFCVCDCTLM